MVVDEVVGNGSERTSGALGAAGDRLAAAVARAAVPGERRLLAGWGRTWPSAALVATPSSAAQVAQLLESLAGLPPDGGRPVGAVARGLGRSYGDAAQCAGGLVVDTAGLGGIGPVDASGCVQVGGGVSLGELVRRVLPGGWFLPVVPGTAHVTVGGAVAADVHGKNHHVDGSFCCHVPSITLATPTGVHRVGPNDDAELFWATAGGMGLTGVVVEATVRLLAVESSAVLVDTVRFDDLDDVMAEMEATDGHYRYSVAWVDCAVRGGRLGRAVLTRGDHAPPDVLRGRWRSDPLAQHRRPEVSVPVTPWRALVTRATVRAFNEAWFRRAPRRQLEQPVSLRAFFHPLDGVAGWNRLYGPAGFVQHQFVVDDRHGAAVTGAVRAIADAGVPAVLAVLKRFGPGDPGPLSFPTAGWTLAVDFPVGAVGLASLLDRLDEQVAAAGGRVYLAKDARLRPELVPVMYPGLGDLARVRRRVDPTGLLASDLSRRLRFDGVEPA